MAETSRITLRLSNDILKVLRQRSTEKSLPLNAIIAQILRKNVIFDTRMNALPSIIMSQALFSLILDKLNRADKEEWAIKGLKTVKNLFTILDLEYNVENVINEYFSMIGKYCYWYSFHYTVDENHYHLVFETELGHGWIEFLQFYIQKILQSLNVTIDNESIMDTVLIVEFNTQTR